MNKAITEGLALMPPAFSAGLNLWSREDGLSGQGSYASQPNAAYVASDQDFGGCLELQKTASVQKLRCFQSIPYQPGLYLRVTVRIKAVAGALCSVRIAGWAGTSGGANVSGIVQTGPEVALTQFGQVVTISAIIGSGNRVGVDLVWGTQPTFSHLGLDLTGATGGIVRIDDITVEDVTEIFHRDIMDVVDVRDYGAIGNGVTDDTAAFLAADQAAAGRMLLVSKGTYYIGGNLTIENRVTFAGTIAMASASRLTCLRNFDLNTYAAAFGSNEEGFRRGVQALFYSPGYVVFDLKGRRVDISAPVDVAALTGLTSLTQRRVIAHGLLSAVPGTAWNTTTVTSVGTYSTAQSDRLTGVANVANIPVGARISGTGVGREVYVTSKNTSSGTVYLSRPLGPASEGSRSYTFERYKYVLDFIGFASLAKFELQDLEVQCNGAASAIMLPSNGEQNRLFACIINKPKDRGITSTGSGCQGLMIDECVFLSNEQPLAAQDRTSIALNVNANDLKFRDGLIVRFGHFAVLGGSGHQIIGNHFYQGDDETLGVRRAGIVFTGMNVKSLLTGNYIDNCFIEQSNEHDPAPSFADEFSFGGLTVTGNIFTVSGAAPWFRWFVVTPRGPGHFLYGMTVSGNAFRAVNCVIDRVDAVDSTYAVMDTSRFRNITFEANTFNAVTQVTCSPLVLEHDQNTAADTWVLDGSGYMPFGGKVRTVVSALPESALRNAAGAVQWVSPYAEVMQGANGQLANLKWPVAVKGRVQAVLRCDTPV